MRERTVRNWMKNSAEPLKRVGRPPHSDEKRKEALYAVARERKVQGKQAGWRKIVKGLAGSQPTRLVQESLSSLKARGRRRKRKRLKEASRRVTVLAKNVIWTQDGLHLGRCRGDEVKGESIKDRATLGVNSLLVGLPACGEDVVLLLKTTKEKKGTLPLVYQTDNESTYLSEVVQDYLREECVVHLLSRVHTPTDNGASEIGIRELKSETGLGKGVRLDSAIQGALQLHGGAVKQNGHLLRASKGYLTPNTLADTLPTWYNRVDRRQFYEETCRAVEKSVQGKIGNRARKAQRDAILNMLNKNGLIVQSHGGRIIEGCEREIVS